MNALDIRQRTGNESPVNLPEIEAGQVGPSSLASTPNGVGLQKYSYKSIQMQSVMPTVGPTQMDDAETMCNRYLNLEKFCESSSAASTGVAEEASLIDRMLDASAIDLINKSSAQCPRFAVSREKNKETKNSEMLEAEGICGRSQLPEGLGQRCSKLGRLDESFPTVQKTLRSR